MLCLHCCIKQSLFRDNQFVFFLGFVICSNAFLSPALSVETGSRGGIAAGFFFSFTGRGSALETIYVIFDVILSCVTDKLSKVTE